MIYIFKVVWERTSKLNLIPHLCTHRTLLFTLSGGESTWSTLAYIIWRRVYIEHSCLHYLEESAHRPLLFALSGGEWKYSTLIYTIWGRVSMKHSCLHHLEESVYRDHLPGTGCAHSLTAGPPFNKRLKKIENKLQNIT